MKYQPFDGRRFLGAAAVFLATALVAGLFTGGGSPVRAQSAQRLVVTVSASPGGVQMGQPVTITYSVFDPNPGQTLRGIFVDFDDGAQQNAPTVPPFGTIVHSYSGTGVYVINVNAVDISMATGEATTTVLVSPGALTGANPTKSSVYGNAAPVIIGTLPIGQEITADLADVARRGYDVYAVQSTVSLDGRDFIGIAGTKTGSADGYTNYIFFYDATRFLQTNTPKPSPSIALLGTGDAGQIDAQYSGYAPGDPLCCPSRPPVTITYNYFAGSIVSNGPPPQP